MKGSWRDVKMTRRVVQSVMCASTPPLPCHVFSYTWLAAGPKSHAPLFIVIVAAAQPRAKLTRHMRFGKTRKLHTRHAERELSDVWVASWEVCLCVFGGPRNLRANWCFPGTSRKWRETEKEWRRRIFFHDLLFWGAEKREKEEWLEWF